MLDYDAGGRSRRRSSSSGGRGHLGRLRVARLSFLNRNGVALRPGFENRRRRSASLISRAGGNIERRPLAGVAFLGPTEGRLVARKTVEQVRAAGLGMVSAPSFADYDPLDRRCGVRPGSQPRSTRPPRDLRTVAIEGRRARRFRPAHDVDDRELPRLSPRHQRGARLAMASHRASAAVRGPKFLLARGAGWSRSHRGLAEALRRSTLPMERRFRTRSLCSAVERGVDWRPPRRAGTRTRCWAPACYYGAGGPSEAVLVAARGTVGVVGGGNFGGPSSCALLALRPPG